MDGQERVKHDKWVEQPSGQTSSTKQGGREGDVGCRMAQRPYAPGAKSIKLSK